MTADKNQAYQRAWQELKMHPLQSLAWQPVYRQTDCQLIAGVPTSIRWGSNPLNRHPFAGVYRAGYDGFDATEWLEALAEDLPRQHPKMSHLVIEPNGHFASWPQQLPTLPAAATNAQYTVINTLDYSYDELLAQASKSHRQNIRKGIDKGLRTQTFTSGQTAINRFMAVMTIMSTSKSFVQFDLSHYQRVWETLSPVGMAYITIGCFQNQDIGGYLVVHNGQTAYQFYGGRTELGRQEKLAQALAFETMWAAKEVGCQQYDMWGIGAFNNEGQLDTNDEKYGIGLFKKSFGGRLFRHDDTRVLVFDQRAYKIFLAGKKVSYAKLRLRKKLGV